MTRSKKIFAAFAFVFAIFLVFIVYDISTRTTFPGSGGSPDTTRAAADSVNGVGPRADSIPR
jgi:hypothetical protein